MIWLCCVWKSFSEKRVNTTNEDPTCNFRIKNLMLLLSLQEQGWFPDHGWNQACQQERNQERDQGDFTIQIQPNQKVLLRTLFLDRDGWLKTCSWRNMFLAMVINAMTFVHRRQSKSTTLTRMESSTQPSTTRFDYFFWMR